MLGLEYSIVTEVNPTTCSTLESGLDCGVLTCALDAKIARDKARVKINQLLFVKLLLKLFLFCLMF